MIATKGYGFSVNDIDWSSPADMEPYIKAHKEELRERDYLAWIQGQYTLSAVICGIERNLAKHPRGKYIEKSIFELAEEREYENKCDRPEYKWMTEEEKQKAELERAKSYFNSLRERTRGKQA